jgi:hypothetical protein
VIRNGTVKTFDRPDGLARVEIYSRPDGLFFFEELAWTQEDGEAYWLPTKMSGLYASAESAEAEAAAMISWVRRRNSI